MTAETSAQSVAAAQASTAKTSPGKAKVETNPYHLWAARFWHGMRLGDWIKLASKNRWRVSLTRIPLAFTVSLVSITNSMGKPLQELILGRQLRRVRVVESPIFIIGHWRSGTTLLHELLVLDQRFTYPTTYECFAPNHFLISKSYVTKLRFLLPRNRPMDNMEAGWDKPQEDEFALCNLGVPSPYLTMAFPNEPPQYPEYLDFAGVPKESVARWKSQLMWFLTRVTYRSQKCIVLKSPPHTSRIKILLEMFPDARFVHIVRDPYALYPSTVKLWKTLYKFQALQEPNHQGLEEYVLSTFERMYQAFDAQRELIPDGQLHEVKYEDLIASPVEQMRAIYDRFKLPGYENVLPKLQAYFRDKKDYKTNRFELDADVRAKIDRRWGSYLRRYGYGASAAAEA